MTKRVLFYTQNVANIDIFMVTSDIIVSKHTRSAHVDLAKSTNRTVYLNLEYSL